MPTHEEHILRILAEAVEPLSTSEITDRMNDEVGGGSAYTMGEISARLQGLSAQVRNSPMGAGRWSGGKVRSGSDTYGSKVNRD